MTLSLQKKKRTKKTQFEKFICFFWFDSACKMKNFITSIHSDFCDFSVNVGDKNLLKTELCNEGSLTK